MKMRATLFLLGFLGSGLLFPVEVPAAVVINEFLADPPAGLAGDANQDGKRSSSQDEFVELLNIGPETADLSFWSLWDQLSLRHEFSVGATLFAFERLVLFGGGSPNGIPGEVVTASTGSLSLNNSSDEIVLKDELGRVVDRVLYSHEASLDQALTRFPEGTGAFQLHTEVSRRGLRFSPGTDPEGENPDPSPAAPEPSTALLFGLGLLFSWGFRASLLPQ